MKRVSRHFNTGLAVFLFFFGCPALAADSGNYSWPPPAAETPPADSDQSRWRMKVLNDFMFDSDDQLSNAISIQRHYPVSETRNEALGNRSVGKRIARLLLPDDSDLVYRRALTVGQVLATPDDKSRADILLNDTPYLGMLAMENSWIAYNNDRLTGFATTIGIVGEYSLAEDLQKAIHKVVDAEVPQGWHNQLDTEPVLNFYYARKYKLWNRRGFDASLTSDLAVGNFATGVDIGLEMRIGQRPDGFAYVPNPIGRGMAYDASLPRKDGRPEIYGTLSAKAWAWAVYMPLEGNTLVDGNEWSENNTIEPKHLVGELTVGLHYVRRQWGLHASVTFATDNVERASLRPDLDVENNVGTVTFEWRFGE
jgi:hypothetical protein